MDSFYSVNSYSSESKSIDEENLDVKWGGSSLFQNSLSVSSFLLEEKAFEKRISKSSSPLKRKLSNFVQDTSSQNEIASELDFQEMTKSLSPINKLHDNCSAKTNLFDEVLPSSSIFENHLEFNTFPLLAESIFPEEGNDVLGEDIYCNPTRAKILIQNLNERINNLKRDNDKIQQERKHEFTKLRITADVLKKANSHAVNNFDQQNKKAEENNLKNRAITLFSVIVRKKYAFAAQATFYKWIKIATVLRIEEENSSRIKLEIKKIENQFKNERTTLISKVKLVESQLIKSQKLLKSKNTFLLIGKVESCLKKWKFSKLYKAWLNLKGNPGSIPIEDYQEKLYVLSSELQALKESMQIINNQDTKTKSEIKKIQSLPYKREMNFQGIIRVLNILLFQSIRLKALAFNSLKHKGNKNLTKANKVLLLFCCRHLSKAKLGHYFSKWRQTFYLNIIVESKEDAALEHKTLNEKLSFFKKQVLVLKQETKVVSTEDKLVNIELNEAKSLSHKNNHRNVASFKIAIIIQSFVSRKIFKAWNVLKDRMILSMNNNDIHGKMVKFSREKALKLLLNKLYFSSLHRAITLLRRNITDKLILQAFKVGNSMCKMNLAVCSVAFRLRFQKVSFLWNKWKNITISENSLKKACFLRIGSMLDKKAITKKSFYFYSWKMNFQRTEKFLNLKKSKYLKNLRFIQMSLFHKANLSIVHAFNKWKNTHLIEVTQVSVGLQKIVARYKDLHHAFRKLVKFLLKAREIALNEKIKENETIELLLLDRKNEIQELKDALKQRVLDQKEIDVNLSRRGEIFNQLENDLKGKEISLNARENCCKEIEENLKQRELSIKQSEDETHTIEKIKSFYLEKELSQFESSKKMEIILNNKLKECNTKIKSFLFQKIELRLKSGESKLLIKSFHNWMINTSDRRGKDQLRYSCLTLISNNLISRKENNILVKSFFDWKAFNKLGELNQVLQENLSKMSSFTTELQNKELQMEKERNVYNKKISMISFLKALYPFLHNRIRTSYAFKNWKLYSVHYLSRKNRKIVYLKNVLLKHHSKLMLLGWIKFLNLNRTIKYAKLYKKMLISRIFHGFQVKSVYSFFGKWKDLNKMFIKEDIIDLEVRKANQRHYLSRLFLVVKRWQFKNIYKLFTKLKTQSLMYNKNLLIQECVNQQKDLELSKQLALEEKSRIIKEFEFVKMQNEKFHQTNISLLINNNTNNKINNLMNVWENKKNLRKCLCFSKWKTYSENFNLCNNVSSLLKNLKGAVLLNKFYNHWKTKMLKSGLRKLLINSHKHVKIMFMYKELHRKRFHEVENSFRKWRTFSLLTEKEVKYQFLKDDATSVLVRNSIIAKQLRDSRLKIAVVFLISMWTKIRKEKLHRSFHKLVSIGNFNYHSIRLKKSVVARANVVIKAWKSLSLSRALLTWKWNAQKEHLQDVNISLKKQFVSNQSLIAQIKKVEMKIKISIKDRKLGAVIFLSSILKKWRSMKLNHCMRKWSKVTSKNIKKELESFNAKLGKNLQDQNSDTLEVLKQINTWEIEVKKIKEEKENLVDENVNLKTQLDYEKIKRLEAEENNKRLNKRNGVAVKSMIQLQGGLDINLKNQVETLKEENAKQQKIIESKITPDPHAIAVKGLLEARMRRQISDLEEELKKKNEESESNLRLAKKYQKKSKEYQFCYENELKKITMIEESNYTDKRREKERVKIDKRKQSNNKPIMTYNEMSESESQKDFDHYTAAASEVQKNLLEKDQEIQQLRNQLDYNSDRQRSRGAGSGDLRNQHSGNTLFNIGF